MPLEKGLALSLRRTQRDQFVEISAGPRNVYQRNSVREPCGVVTIAEQSVLHPLDGNLVAFGIHQINGYRPAYGLLFVHLLVPGAFWLFHFDSLHHHRDAAPVRRPRKRLHLITQQWICK